jgi:signal transduction histidine kinase
VGQTLFATSDSLPGNPPQTTRTSVTRGTVKTHRRKTEFRHRSNVLTVDKDLDPDLRIELQQCERGQLIEEERLAAIGRMACSISHDMLHSLSSIYANAGSLQSRDLCPSTRADLLLGIQEAVRAMTERIDSLLQFGKSGRNNPFVHGHVSEVVEKAIAAVKFHPDGRNVSIAVGRLPPVEADIDARRLESAIYHLLLNACQAVARSTCVPEVNVHVAEVDEQICITIRDTGPGIPAAVRRTLFNPFVKAGKPNGAGLGLTLSRQVAEEHGGSVRLEDSNPGRTQFTLSLMKNRISSLRSKSPEPFVLFPALKSLQI